MSDDRDVRVRASFVDEVSGPVKTMSGGMQGAFDNVKSSSDSLLSSVVSLAKGFLGLAAVNTAKNMLVGFANGADKAITSNAKLAGAVRNSGDAAGKTLPQLMRMADALQEVTLYGDETTESAMGLLLAFSKIGGGAFDRAIKVSQDLATVMGTDLNSATIKVGRALESPETGLSALAEAGIVFTKEQRKSIQALMDSGKAAEAQGRTLDVLESKVGGMAEVVASQGLGPWKQMINVFGDVGEEVGAQMLPSLTRLAGTLKAIAPIVQDVMSATVRFGTALVEVVSSVLQAVNAVAFALTTTLSAALWMAIGLVNEAVKKIPGKLIPDSWRKGLQDATDAVKHFATVNAETMALAGKSAADSWSAAWSAISQEQTAEASPLRAVTPEATEKERPTVDKERLAAVKGLTEELAGYQRSARQQEIAEVQAWYAERVKLTEGNDKLALALADIRVEKLLEIEDRYRAEAEEKEKERAAAIKGVSDELARYQMSDKERELDDLRAWYEEKLAIVGENEDLLAELLEVKYQQQAEIEARYKEEAAAAAQAQYEQEIANFDSFASQLIGTADKIVDARISGIQRQLDKEVASIKSSKNSQAEKDKLISEATKKAEKEQKEAAKVQQEIALVQAIINTALGVTNALSIKPTALGVAMAILIGAAGAAEISTIASQTFAQGGIVQGPSMGDRVQVTANVGEMILTREQQAELFAIARGSSPAPVSFARGSSSAQAYAPVTIGGTTIVIQGNADASTVTAIEGTMERKLEDMRELMLEMQYRGQAPWGAA